MNILEAIILKSTQKRILSLLLTVLLVAALFPAVPALAAEGDIVSDSMGNTYLVTSVTDKTAALIGVPEGTLSLNEEDICHA